MFGVAQRLYMPREGRAWVTQSYWQDIGCSEQTFMQEKQFGLRQNTHLHVFDAMLRLIHKLGLGSAVQSSP